MSNDGKDLELIVKLIEESIDPNSRIEHDVMLPVLTSNTGAKRQCDVVIRSGTPQRETLTIIEVQDRNYKVSVNDFGGWLVKLDQVGAQHLICVSRKPFSKSIKEMANQSGNKVRLINIGSSDNTKIPKKFLNLLFEYRDFNILSINRLRLLADYDTMVKFGFGKEHVDNKEVNSKEKIFTYDKNNFLSIHDLSSESIPSSCTKTSSKFLKFSHSDSKPFYCLIESKLIPCDVEIEIEYSDFTDSAPFSVISYEQDMHGVLAWIAEASYESAQGTIGVRIPIIPFGDKFKVVRSSFNLPNDVEISIEIAKSKKV